MKEIKGKTAPFRSSQLHEIICLFIDGPHVWLRCKPAAFRVATWRLSTNSSCLSRRGWRAPEKRGEIYRLMQQVFNRVSDFRPSAGSLRLPGDVPPRSGAGDPCALHPPEAKGIWESANCGDRYRNVRAPVSGLESGTRGRWEINGPLGVETRVEQRPDPAGKPHPESNPHSSLGSPHSHSSSLLSL